MDIDEDAAAARVKELDSEEPLLMVNPKRFVVFPIKHTDIWQFYKKAEGKWLSLFNSLTWSHPLEKNQTGLESCHHHS